MCAAAVDTAWVASVAHEIPRSRERRALRARPLVRVAPLGGLVALSFAVRALLAFLRPTPAYYPDEYLYAELGRSIATTGHATVRGGAAHFPALLQPLLAAPAWLVDDVTISYRLVQIGGAFAMSLAAVPVYLLARRLGTGAGVAFAAAALTLTGPDLIYAGWVLSEPVAYPLALAAASVAVLALAQPTRRRQIGFLALACLATFARAQLAVLFPVFVGGAVVIGLRERRVKEVLREQRLPLTVIGVFSVAAAVAGSAALGIYGAVVHPRLSAGGVAGSIGADLLVLAYASGWILVPGALLGLSLGLARPRSRLELSFAATAATFAAGLLFEAAVWGQAENVQERYLFYLLPLAAVSFCVYAARGWPARRLHAGFALGLLLVAALVPLTGWTIGTAKNHSPFLFAAFELERILDQANGSLAIAAAAAALSVAAMLVSLRRATSVALALAVVASAAASAGAASFDSRTTHLVRRGFLAPDPSWVDHARVGRTTLLRTPGTPEHDGLEQLFWNRSVRRVVALPGSSALDAFAAGWAQVGADGTLRSRGRALTGPVLADGTVTTLVLRNARPVARSRRYVLWRPAGRVQLALDVRGRYYDGWLAPRGQITVWPSRAGKGVHGLLSFRLDAKRPVSIRFGKIKTGRGVLQLPLCSDGPVGIRFSATEVGFDDGRVVSARASVPVFRPDAAAC